MNVSRGIDDGEGVGGDAGVGYGGGGVGGSVGGGAGVPMIAARSRHPRKRELTTYAARPMSTYRTPLDGRQLAALARHFPEATVLDPAVMFGSNEDWLAEWPGILARLDLLAVWADEEGMVGAGCIRELADAIGARLPVVAIDRRGLLRSFGGVWANEQLVVDRGRVGRLVHGAPLFASEVLAAGRARRQAKAGERPCR